LATSPQYAVSPDYAVCTVTTADSSYTAPTNYQTLFTGTSTAKGTGVGHRILRCSTVVQGSNAGSVIIIRFFTSTDNLSTFKLLHESMIYNNTAGTTAPAANVSVPFLEGLIIPGSTGGNAFKLVCATSQSFNVNVHLWVSAL
jgi:hypothetical protein